MRVCRLTSLMLSFGVALAVLWGCDKPVPAAPKAAGAATGAPSAAKPEEKAPASKPASPAAKPVTTITGDAAKGKRVWGSYGCATCHMLDGPSPMAPALKGMWMTVRKLSDGREVIADVEYLRRSVMEPQAEIVPGFPAPMTSFKGLMDDEQLDDLVAYIRSLSN